jgi:hypothetical protein
MVPAWRRSGSSTSASQLNTAISKPPRTAEPKLSMSRWVDSPAVQVEVGVDESGQQHRPGRVDLPGACGVGADDRTVDHHRARLGQPLPVEDRDAG